MRLLSALAMLLASSSAASISAASFDDCSCAPAPSCAAPIAACDSCGSNTCNSCGSGCSLTGLCGTCGGLSSCATCGINACCWDCTYSEGIDIESLTPESQSKKLYELSQAKIIFKVPESAGVWLGDQRMTSLGKKREYIVQILDQTKSYKYEGKVDVVINGQKYFRRIPMNGITAGSIITVSVEVPEVAEDEVPAINHNVSMFDSKKAAE